MKLFKNLTTILLVTILLVGCSTNSTVGNTNTDNSKNNETVEEKTKDKSEEKVGDNVEDASSDMFTIVNSKLTDTRYGNRDFACVFTIQNNSSLTLESVSVYVSIIDAEGNVLSTDEGSTSARILTGKTVDVTIDMNNENVKGGSYIIADKIYYRYGDNKLESVFTDYDEAMKYAIPIQ